MIIRSLDSSGDVNFGKGLNSFATGNAAIGEDIQTRVLSFLNTCFWAMNFGVDWWNLLGSKNPAAQNGILLQVRQMILGNSGGYASFGVTAINEIDVVDNAYARAIQVIFNISSIFSTSSAGVVQPLSA